MNNDREQEFASVFGCSESELNIIMERRSEFRWRPIAIVWHPEKREYVAFLQRDKPVSDEVL